MRFGNTFVVLTMAISIFCLVPERAAAQKLSEEQRVQEAYRNYVAAWRAKDISALQKLIADDYMSVNPLGGVDTKKQELTSAKSDPPYEEMRVEDIHGYCSGRLPLSPGVPL
jgi:hypothetical protein